MENTESLDADVILPDAEFRRMRADNEHLDAAVCRLELFVAELQGDLGAALNDRDRLAAENARLREAGDAVLGSFGPDEERWFTDEMREALDKLALLVLPDEDAARSLTEAQP